ncbi:hypothetical protein ACNJ7K_11565 [Rhodococcus aetherivorans]
MADADFTMTVVIQTSGQIGIAVRYVAANNSLLLTRVSNEDRSWRLVKRSAGGSTEVAQLGVTMANGDVVRVRAPARRSLCGSTALSGIPEPSPSTPPARGSGRSSAHPVRLR